MPQLNLQFFSFVFFCSCDNATPMSNYHLNFSICFVIYDPSLLISIVKVSSQQTFHVVKLNTQVMSHVGMVTGCNSQKTFFVKTIDLNSNHIKGSPTSRCQSLLTFAINIEETATKIEKLQWQLESG